MENSLRWLHVAAGPTVALALHGVPDVKDGLADGAVGRQGATLSVEGDEAVETQSETRTTSSRAKSGRRIRLDVGEGPAVSRREGEN